MDSPSTRVWHPGLVLNEPSELTRDIVEAIKVALSPAQTLGLTAFREAEARLEPGKGWRPNPIDAMADVMCVVDNRARDPRWKALDHKAICLQKSQFSCWMASGGSDNFYALLRLAQALIAGLPVVPKLEACVQVAQSVLDGRHPDEVDNATHYYAPESMVPQGRVPNWVAGARLTVERYGHKFYAEVK